MRRRVVAVVFVALAAFGAGCAKQEEHSATTTDSTLSATPAPPPAPDTTSTAQGTEPQKPATPPEHILVQHVLIGFQGSVQGKPITRSKADAEKLANEVLAKARAGENFDALVQAHTDDQFPGVYALANTGVTKDPTKQEYGRDEMVSGFSVTRDFGAGGGTALQPFPSSTAFRRCGTWRMPPLPTVDIMTAIDTGVSDSCPCPIATEIVSPGYQRSPVRFSFHSVFGTRLSCSLGRSIPVLPASPSFSAHL